MPDQKGLLSESVKRLRAVQTQAKDQAKALRAAREAKDKEDRELAAKALYQG